jgi:hypothetical protein
VRISSILCHCFLVYFLLKTECSYSYLSEIGLTPMVINIVSLLIKMKGIEPRTVTDTELCDTSGNATVGVCAGIHVEDSFGQDRSGA